MERGARRRLEEEGKEDHGRAPANSRRVSSMRAILAPRVGREIVENSSQCRIDVLVSHFGGQKVEAP